MGLLDTFLGIFGVNKKILYEASENNEIEKKIKAIRQYALYKLTGKISNEPDIKNLNFENLGPHKIIRKKKKIRSF